MKSNLKKKEVGLREELIQLRDRYEKEWHTNGHTSLSLLLMRLNKIIEPESILPSKSCNHIIKSGKYKGQKYCRVYKGFKECCH